jgi:hypothetical protein
MHKHQESVPQKVPLMALGQTISRPFRAELALFSTHGAVLGWYISPLRVYLSPDRYSTSMR